MATVIDELVTILGFDMDSDAMSIVQNFNSKIDMVTQYAGWASAALLAAASSVTYFSERSADAAADIDKFAQLTGLATETIQELSFATEQAGGDASSMQRDLDSLTRSMSSPIPGEFNHALFMLGISATDAGGRLKDADEVMLEIADTMQGMAAQRQLQWGSKIGLSDDTIRLLQKGRGEIDRLRKQAQDIPTVVDKESLENARMFVTQLSLIRRVFTYIGQEVASSAGPAIKEVVELTVEWIKQNREFIQLGLKNLIEGIIGGFRRFVAMLDRAASAIGDAVPWLKDFVVAMTEAEAVSSIVFAALSALSIVLIVLGAKFLLIIGIVVAAGLVIEDFLTYLEGGESVFGDFMSWLDGLWQSFATNFPAIADLIETLLGLLGDFMRVAGGSLLRSFELLGKVIAGAFEIGIEKAKILLDLAERALQFLGFGDDEGQGAGAGVARYAMPPRPTHAVPSTTNTQASGNTIQITNHISGENAVAIASETTRKMNFTLQQLSPGGLAPVTN